MNTGAITTNGEIGRQGCLHSVDSFRAAGEVRWCKRGDTVAKDVVDLAGEYLSDDPLRWAKLASDVTYRRMEILLLREILVELRKLSDGVSRPG